MRSKGDENPLIGLLHRARAGDSEAREELVMEMEPAVRPFLERRLRGDPEGMVTAEDLTQETLIRAVQGLSGCRADTDRQLLSWCLSIARNQLVDYLRTRRRCLALLEHALDLELRSARAALEEWTRGQEDEPSEGREILLRLLVRVYEDLASGTRHLLWLRLVGSAPWQEVASELGTTADGAKRRYQRAQGALRRAAVRRIDALPAAERMAVLACLGIARASDLLP